MKKQNGTTKTKKNSVRLVRATKTPGNTNGKSAQEQLDAKKAKSFGKFKPDAEIVVINDKTEGRGKPGVNRLKLYAKAKTVAEFVQVGGRVSGLQFDIDEKVVEIKKA